MKRFLAGLLLLCLIILTISFTVGRWWSRGSDDNFFNTNYRAALSRNQVWRIFFDLHETGDAKSDYLGPHYSEVLIEVDSMYGFAPTPETMYRLAEQIQEVTHKSTSVIFSDEEIPVRELSTAADLDQVIKAFRNYNSHDNTAVVYLLVADKPPEDPALLGSTRRADQIVLYTQALKDFTLDASSTYNNYFLSTALHEFGHLLGLPHNDRPGCLMNVNAEADHVPKFNAKDVVTDFCAYEVELLKQAEQHNVML